MLNLKEIAHMLEGLDFQRMNDNMEQMNSNLVRVVELLEQAVTELKRDKIAEFLDSDEQS